jgi:hypothetical protein
MAWNVESQTMNTPIPASRLNQLQDNFAAMAAQNSGAPVILFPNSVLNANAGIASTGVGSFGRVNANSGVQTTQPVSGGVVNATSGFNTAQVGSFGLLDASSGVQVEVMAPAAPIAGRYYKDTAIRAWAVYSDNGVIDSQVGVSGVANAATGIYVVTLATAFSSSLSWCPMITTRTNNTASEGIRSDQRSQGAGSVALTARNSADALANRSGNFWAVGS